MKRSPVDMMRGAILGATAMYLLDPQRGRRRRALFRDRFKHLRRTSGEMAEIGVRDLSHRMQGIVSETTQSVLHRRDRVDDPVLECRVRSKLGRLVSHPHAVHVQAQNGRVLLTGDILSHELTPLLASVNRIRGIRNVENRLDAHDRLERVPALQGGRLRPGSRIDLFQDRWAPATRILMGLTGTSLLSLGVSRLKTRKPAMNLILNSVLSSAGALVLARSVLNQPIPVLLGMNALLSEETLSRFQQAQFIHKTLNFSAPVEQIYRLAINFPKIPALFDELAHVEALDDNTYRWHFHGPLGIPMTNIIQITERIPHRILRWETLPGSAIHYAATARFFATSEKSAEKGTKVELTLRRPPEQAGLASLRTRILSSNFKSRLEKHLMRFRQLVEQGPTRRQESDLKKLGITTPLIGRRIV